jgi:uncharacterized membrane protein YkoI
MLTKENKSTLSNKEVQTEMSESNNNDIKQKVKQVLNCKDITAENISRKIIQKIPGEITDLSLKSTEITKDIEVVCANGKKYLVVVGRGNTITEIYEGDYGGKRIYYIMR